MTDIDFDEIDRAVNSASNTNNTTPSGANQGAPIVNISRSMDGISPKPSLNVSDPINSSPSLTMPRKVFPSLASRRGSGRFMDMVRSSNPRPTQTLINHGQNQVNQASNPIVTPSSPSVVNLATNTIQPPVEQMQPINTAAQPVAFNPEQPRPSIDSLPVERTAADNQPAVPVVAPSSNNTPNNDLDFIESDFSKASTAKLDGELPESPFLADAKVDKRPLGAFSGDPRGAANTVVASAAMSGVAPSIVQPATSIAPVAPVNVYDVESTTIAAQPVQSQVIQAQPVAPSTTVANTQGDSLTVTANSPSPQANQAADTQNNNGSIYDSSNFQKTIAHPAKQTAGWMWVVWIIMLLLIGAGAGAIVYFFVI